MFGVVLVIKDHFEIRPWVKVAWAACGWVLAMSDSKHSSLDQPLAFPETKSSMKDCVPIGEPRYALPSAVIDTRVFSKVL